MKLKIALVILRILLGLIFIFSAISKLFPIEVFELNFVYQGIVKWELATYLARGLIIVELFLGISLLFDNLLKQLILPATFFLLLFFTCYLFYSIAKFGSSGNCGCFGTILPMTPWEAVVKNIILIVITCFIYVKSTTKLPRFIWLIPSVFIFVSTSIVLLYPIYDYSFSSKQVKGELATISNITGFSGKEKVNLKEGKKLVAVFNMACSHCVEIALKLSAAKSRTPLPPTYYILLGDSDEVQKFYDLTYSSASYVLMNGPEYIRKYKSGWPQVFLLNNGLINYDGDYRTFNGQDFESKVKIFLAE